MRFSKNCFGGTPAECSGLVEASPLEYMGRAEHVSKVSAGP